MRRVFIFLMLALASWQNASAEVRQLKLLNPDDSAAVDAQAIVIMLAGTRVDDKLKELPPLLAPEPGKTCTVVAKNDEGTIHYDSNAFAVLAQNKAGFAFIPLPLRTSVVKLRPWAKLKIDLTDLIAKSQTLSKTQKICVLWENCFAGHPIRPSSGASDDPFADPLAPPKEDPFGGSEPPVVDWRFDSFVMWSLVLDPVAEQVVNVPPGEVTMILADGDIHTATATNGIPLVRFTPMRTYSGKESTFKAPKCETIRGKLAEDSSLPDWAAGNDNSLFVYANPAPEPMPEEFQKLFSGLNRVPGNMLDELSRRYASEVGMRYRYSLERTATARVQPDGSFVLTHVPAGKVVLELLGPSFHAPVSLKRSGQASDTPITLEITGDLGNLGSNDVGEVERFSDLQKAGAPVTKAAPGDDPFNMPSEQPKARPDASIQAVPQNFPQPAEPRTIEEAEQRIHAALAQRVDVDFVASPLSAVLNELGDRCGVPIYLSEAKLDALKVNYQQPVTATLPRMSLQSALRHILSGISEEITFTVRDEVLLITTKTDAARESAADDKMLATASELDTGDAFVEEWLKSAPASGAKANDPDAMRGALRAHLEKEFDAKQQSRQAELSRLRTLLKQSEDYINDRQRRRAEIVNKKVNELLEKSKAAR